MQLSKFNECELFGTNTPPLTFPRKLFSRMMWIHLELQCVGPICIHLFGEKRTTQVFFLQFFLCCHYIKLYLILFLTFKCFVIYHNWCTSNIGKQLKFDMVFMFEKMYQSCVDLRSCGQLRPQIITRRKLYVFAIFLLPIIFCNFKLNSSETLLFGLCSWSWCLLMKTPDDYYNDYLSIVYFTLDYQNFLYFLHIWLIYQNILRRLCIS